MAIRINLNLMILIIVLVFGIGVACGRLGFLLLGDIASHCRVLFVAKEKIIELEEGRIKKFNGNFNGAGDQMSKMFLGRPDLALKLIREIAQSYGDRKTKIVFVSGNVGRVKGGYNISEQVYKRTIKLLAEKNEEEGSK